MKKILFLLFIVSITFGLISCTGDKEITITFNSNGGTEVEDMEVSTNQTSLNLPTPTKEGYTFDGWFLDEALTEPFTIGALLTNETLTLYAKWILNVASYTITFNSNGGSAVSPITQASGTAVTAPTAPTKEGFTFAGWFANVELTTTYTFTTMPAQNITLYAKWDAVIVQTTITFETNGGGTIAPVTADIGSSISAPSNPSKVGHTFAGWYSDLALTTAFTFTTMPATHTTLYAKWTVNQYTITYNTNGGSPVNPVNYNYNTPTFAPVVPAKEGHTFAGWYSDVALTNSYVFNTMPAENITLYAKWTLNTYTVSFNSNDGSSVTAITQNFGTTLNAPIAPTKEGHTFAGWYSNIELTTSYTFTTMPAQNITLYAKWTVNQYTITFNSNSGTLVSAITQNYNTSVVAPSNPTKEGHNFAGWYSNIELTTSYTFTTMPAQNITLYAKWNINQYTITFNSNGGSLVSDLTQNYGTSITAPINPTKLGFSFEGWYSDVGLTTPYVFTTIPAQNITLYAKWIVLVVYDMIGEMNYEEPTSVHVRGVIYYKFPLAMNPGFYIYDGTGYIFVLGSTEFAVGQGIEFEATYSVFEFTPQLTDITNIQINNTFTTMPTYIETSLESIAHANPSTPTLNGKTVIVDGYVEKYGMEYALVPNFSDQKVFINFKSIQGLSDPFLTKVGTRIQIHAVVFGYSPMQNAWHILYQPSVPIVDIILTDQEKVDEILARGVEELDGKSFFTTQILYIPNTDPFYSSTISWEPIGMNASYVNMATGEFMSVDDPIDIIIRLTVTIGLVTDSVDVTIHLLPYETMTIEAFKLLPDMSYGIVSGVVIFSSSDMGVMIVADETGILAIICNNVPDYGDLVVAGGYLASMDGLIIMTDDEGDTLIEIVSNNQVIPLSPTSISISDFLALDPELPSSWIQYVEITGTIYYEEANHSYYLEDMDGALMILALNEDSRDLLGAYQGFEVEIKGIIFPNFDPLEDYLMFVFSGEPDDINMALSEEELVLEMSDMLKEYLESKTYYPGQILYLPTDHPVIPITVSYYTNAPALFNISTYQVSTEIFEPVDITLEATLTLGIYSNIILITLHVAPIEVMAISDFILTGGTVSAYINGVVIFKIEDYITTYMVADETGVLFLISEWNLDVGTEVLLYGEYLPSDMMPFIVTSTSYDPVLEIISFDQPNPMIPTEISLADFMSLDVDDPTTIFKFFTLKGVLSKLDFDFVYMLDDGVNQVAIYAPVPEAIAALNSYLGYYISLSGLSMPMGDEDQMMLIYLGEAEHISLGGTDQEIFTELANSMIAYYASTTFVQGIYHKLPTSTLTFITYEYTKGTNGAYYDLVSGFISTAITSETYIEIHVTLTVQSYTNSFNILIHVIPVETITISEFILGSPDTLYLIRGVVVYSQFFSDGGFFMLADHTGYLIVPIDLDLIVGGEYIIEAMVDTVMGVKTLKEGTINVVDLVATDVANPLFFIPTLIADLFLLDPEDTDYWGTPIELIGYIVNDNFGDIYFTDAYGSISKVKIHVIDYMLYQEIYEYRMLKIKLKGYLLPNMNEGGIDGFSLFVDINAEPVLCYTTDQEKIDAFIELAEYSIQDPVSGKSYLDLPNEFEILGATITWSQIAGPMIFNPITKYIDNVPELTTITLQASITVGSLTLTHDFMIDVIPFVVLTIPNYEYTIIEGLFPGLLIHSVGYVSNFMGGTVFNVHLVFPAPESIGADYFVLEYFSESEQIWKTFMYQDEPLTTWFYNTWEETWMNSTNFSLNLPIDTEYRLRAVGTPEPIVSNAVFVEGSSFNTQFIGWNMDGSMYLTGVMMPEYGFGLEVSATIYDHDLDMEIEDALIYEWYRVNPFTYEMTLIPDAHESLYITTFEDVGFIILARIKGDGISAGGYVQIISWETVKVYNVTRLVSASTTGFVLEFSHLFNPSDLEHMVIFDDAYNELIITNIIPTADPFVFEFEVDLSETYYASLQLWIYTWIMVKESEHGYHYEMIEIYLD